MNNEMTNSESQAKAQLESIVEMITRYDHARECDGEDCELTSFGEFSPEDYHNADEAEQAIWNDPLSVEVRSGWTAASDMPMVAEEFCILLCTGGPAVRIIGDLDNGQPSRPRIQHQDWGTQWTEYFHDNHDELESFCNKFYFGD